MKNVGRFVLYLWLIFLLKILKSKKEYDPLSDNLTEEATVPPERNKRLSFSNLKSTKKDVDNDNDETRNRRVSFSNLRVVKYVIFMNFDILT